jgi:hypothetical protein
MALYTLPDEPRPGALQTLATDPMWPFLSTMLIGSWFGLAWFVLNGLALGSPTLRREIGCVVLALGGKALVVLGMVAALQAGWVEKGALPYLYVFGVAILLAGTYALYLLQSRTFELFSHFGGESKNGVVVVVLGLAILRPYVAPLLGDGLVGLVLR